MKRCIRSFVAFCLLVAMLTLPLSSLSQTAKQTKPSFLLESGEGLTMARLVAPEGTVWINLPDEIASGDTISGTVFVEPKGANPAEKAQNLDVLNGYVIDLGDGKKVKADKPAFSWTPQISQPSTPMKYVLRTVEVLSSDGKSLASGDIPILTTPPPVPIAVNFPTLGQTGHPVQISGPFDGDSANTNCDIGGQTMRVIAESPRKTIVRAPTTVIGPSQITVSDNHVRANGTIRIVGVSLTAPKTNLAKGEKTTLSILVIGLQGLTTPVPLLLVTTGSVSMQGGNTQNILIQPGQAGGGTFTQSFGLTGLEAGGFEVRATVITGGPAAGGDKNKL